MFQVICQILFKVYMVKNYSAFHTHPPNVNGTRICQRAICNPAEQKEIEICLLKNIIFTTDMTGHVRCENSTVSLMNNTAAVLLPILKQTNKQFNNILFQLNESFYECVLKLLYITKHKQCCFQMHIYFSCSEYNSAKDLPSLVQINFKVQKNY